MPRAFGTSDIYALRQKNYLFFLNEHKQFLAFPPEDQELFTKISRLFEMPRLTITGCHVDGFWLQIAKVGTSHGVPEPMWGMISPYATAEGWPKYQKMFQQLPDPVEIPKGINVTEWLSVEL